MSSFTEPLTVTKLASGTWITATPFRYYVGEEGSNDFIDVPVGTETDFASIPRPFWSILPPDGKYSQAAVLHDFLYSQRKIHKRSREECDNIFLEAMKVLNVNWWKRHAMHKAVRSFGWIPWRSE